MQVTLWVCTKQLWVTKCHNPNIFTITVLKFLILYFVHWSTFYLSFYSHRIGEHLVIVQQSPVARETVSLTGSEWLLTSLWNWCPSPSHAGLESGQWPTGNLQLGKMCISQTVGEWLREVFCCHWVTLVTVRYRCCTENLEIPLLGNWHGNL